VSHGEVILILICTCYIHDLPADPGKDRDKSKKVVLLSLLDNYSLFQKFLRFPPAEFCPILSPPPTFT